MSVPRRIEIEDAARLRSAGPPAKDAVQSILALLEQTLRDKGVSSLSLFGSIVHGDARAGSDVDVLIDVRPDARFGLVSLVSLKLYLEERLGRPVDVVTRAGIAPTIRDAVLGEAERVF